MTPNCGVAHRYSSVIMSGGTSRPAKCSRIPPRDKQGGAEADGGERPRRQHRGGQHQRSRHRNPAEHHPCQPDDRHRAESRRDVAIGIGRQRDAASHAPPGDALAHGVSDGEQSDQRGDQNQHQVHRDGERQQQRAGDRQREADHQHAECGQHQDLSEKSGEKTATERVRDCVRHDLEIGAPERHEAEPQHGEHQQQSGQAGGVPRNLSGDWFRRTQRLDRRVERLRGPADRSAAHRVNPAADGERVADDGATGKDGDVAVERHDISFDPTVHLRVAFQHHDMAVHRLVRTDGVSSNPGRSAHHRQARCPDRFSQRRSQLPLEQRGLAQGGRG